MALGFYAFFCIAPFGSVTDKKMSHERQNALFNQMRIKISDEKRILWASRKHRGSYVHSDFHRAQIDLEVEMILYRYNVGGIDIPDHQLPADVLNIKYSIDYYEKMAFIIKSKYDIYHDRDDDFDDAWIRSIITQRQNIVNAFRTTVQAENDAIKDEAQQKKDHNAEEYRSACEREVQRKNILRYEDEKKEALKSVGKYNRQQAKEKAERQLVREKESQEAERLYQKKIIARNKKLGITYKKKN